MRWKSRPLILLLLLLSLVCAIPYAAPAHEITPEQWNHLTSDKAFSYKNEREKQMNRKEAQSDPFTRFIRSFTSLFSSSLGTMLVWLIVFFVAAYVIYSLTISNNSIFFRKEIKQMAPSDIGNISEDIFSTDWNLLLQQALANDDTRLAIRSSYMWLLQMLQKKQLISYSQNKTNNDYYYELTQTPYKQQFRQLSRQYEYAWYGHFPVQSGPFSEYMDLFNSVKTDLQK